MVLASLAVAESCLVANGRDVYLHPHQPDTADECGHSALQEGREAVRDSVLQEQGSLLAE